jgi:hypothetical protein
MVEPRIKPALESAEFTTEVTPSVRARLESCLRSDPAHIMPKSRGGQDGPQVEAVQKALKKINAALPLELKIGDITDAAGVYGQNTADVVRKYKELNAIQRTGQPLDDVVGRMTISALDDELKNLRLRPGPSPRPPTPPSPDPPAPNRFPTAFCLQNGRIFLDGTTAVKRSPPMSPAEWVGKTQATFDTICSNRLGNQIVKAVREEVVIRPFLKNEANARSDGQVFIIVGAWELEFTADNFDGIQNQPGARADEILLHELIHMIEHNFSGYDNAADNSMIFDDLDFLTVNGTNVYSTTQTRSIRKDHAGFVIMPPRYATDAREHMILFRENYEKGFDNNQSLFNLFKNQTATWNPFASFTRGVTKMQFRVRVSADREFEWLYDLFSDSTARWRDTKNVAEYGTGTWRTTTVVEPPDLISRDVVNVDWKGGGFDRFPLRAAGTTVDGRNKTGGVERDSKVTQQ